MQGIVIVVVYAVIGLAVIGLGFLLYSFAVASRRSYRCPQCGEELTTEYLKASRCNMCGAPLDLKR